MISNTDYIIVYHKTTENHEDIWTSYVYEKVWCFDNKNSTIKDGYENSNKLHIRIPYDKNPSANIRHFDFGDIVVKFKPGLTVAQVNELKVKELDQLELINFVNTAEAISDFDINIQGYKNAYDVYCITSVKNNIFGRQKHIHLEAR